MKVEDLAGIIDTICDGLKSNKALVSADQIQAAATLLQRLQGDENATAALATVLCYDSNRVDNILAAINTILSVERQLIVEGMGDKLISGLQALKGRSLIMDLLATVF